MSFSAKKCISKMIYFMLLSNTEKFDRNILDGGIEHGNDNDPKNIGCSRGT